MTSVIIGIDPGPCAGGVAALSTDGQFVGWLTVMAADKRDIMGAGDEYRHAVGLLLRNNSLFWSHVEHISVETFSYMGPRSQNMNATLTGQLAWHLVGLFTGMGHQVYAFEPRDWRKDIVGNAKAKDRDTRAVVKLRHPATMELLKGKTLKAMSHVCDALCIAEHGLIQTKRTGLLE